MAKISTLVGSSLAAAALLASTAVSATAQSDKIVDKRADVVQYDGYNDETGTVLNRADSIATGRDATSATVKYGKKTLRVTMRFADLHKGTIEIYGGIRVKGKKTWPSYQIIGDGARNRIAVYNRNYSKFLCTGKLTRKNGVKGSISYRIANSCFNKPKSIKVQSGLYGFAGDPDLADVTYYDESISSTRVKRTSHTKWLKAS